MWHAALAHCPDDALRLALDLAGAWLWNPVALTIRPVTGGSDATASTEGSTASEITASDTAEGPGEVAATFSVSPGTESLNSRLRAASGVAIPLLVGITGVSLAIVLVGLAIGVRVALASGVFVAGNRGTENRIR